jgi:hypothetical protein
MSRRFAAAKKRYGLDAALHPLDLARFRVPPQSGDQLELFGSSPA